MNLRQSSSTLPIFLSLVFCAQVCAQTVERPERKEGDTWTYRYRQGATLIAAGPIYYTEASTVTKVGPNGYEYVWVTTAERGGEQKTGTARRTHNLNWYARPRSDAPWQEVKAWEWPLEVGRTWKYELPVAGGSQIWEVRVKGWEEVAVPAGKFKTLRIDFELIANPDPIVYRKRTVWYSPDARVSAKIQDWGTYEGSIPTINDTRELESYQLR